VAQFENPKDRGGLVFEEVWRAVGESCPFIRGYYEVLTSEEVFPLFEDFAVKLSYLVKVEARLQPYAVGSAYGLEREEEWIECWTDVAWGVVGGGVMKSDLSAGQRPLQPPDVLNAVWVKLLRKDFRNVPTFTIDPSDAKDFDDALSLRKLKNGNWEVGVHIADVTHYVKPKSIIDQEGYERGTSVYLVDRVVPMLPEKLSNFICSLRPDEEKLCYSAVFEMNNNGDVLHEWFGRTVIRSDRRFTYEEAQEIIETGKGELKDV
jgi:hypothetical protein